MQHLLQADRRSRLGQAHRARHAGRSRRAIEIYRRMLLEDPGDIEVAMRLAPLLAARGGRFEAWQLLRDAAKRLLGLRRFEECLAVAREACRWLPQEYDAWRLRADLEIKLGREQTAYETLIEGRHHFDTTSTRPQAIALLTRARALEPWDPDLCLDLAALYAGTDQSHAALELLAALSVRVSGRQLRRVRALQLRLTLSPAAAWAWLQALASEFRADPPSSEVLAESRVAPRLR